MKIPDVQASDCGVSGIEPLWRGIKYKLKMATSKSANYQRTPER